MLLSTRLAFIASRFLAQAYYDGKWTTAPEIAGRYNINVRALTPALQGLTRAGILKSRVGGRTPGFIFVKEPTDIMLSEIMNALEKKEAMSCCKELIPGLVCDCSSMGDCRIFALFESISKEISHKFSNISVAEYSGVGQNKIY